MKASRARRARATPPLPDLRRYGTLAEYNRRRHFGVTPEPAGRMRTKPAGVRPREFVIQKHRAGHLHYDFRLEHRGVMLSWAVPKGPSLDPGVKRLAMETEPHPMDYNQFEGVIPEGEYGGGTVMIWDRGVWTPAAGDQPTSEREVDRQLAAGELKFAILGKKLVGGFTLVRTRPRQWLLIKHRDSWASAADLTLTKPRSVVSSRAMAGIARAAGATERQQEQAAAADPPAGDRPRKAPPASQAQRRGGRLRSVTRLMR
ncbi:MAG: DNA polymerase ligase N-terminal domain-containing protein [Candidatus Rokuibacteriota bacterium]